jgi:hypothetical protein
VPIDGTPDSVSTAPATWQMVQQAGKGALVTTSSLTTDIAGLASSTYYLDQSPASPTPCTGDVAAWGQDGQASTGPGGGNLPCTDPTIYGSPGSCPTVVGQATANSLSVTRHRYVELPGFTAAQAATLAADTAAPLQTTVSGALG